MALEELLTADELAAKLKTTRGAIYQRVEANTIPFIRIGRSLRFSPSAIEAWLAKGAVRPPDERKGAR